MKENSDMFKPVSKLVVCDAEKSVSSASEGLGMATLVTTACSHTDASYIKHHAVSMHCTATVEW